MLHLGHIDLEINDVRGESIAVLGIKGSGKTNTTAVIVEDVIGDIPFTIIDPQGEYYGLKEQFDILIAGCGPQVELPVDPDQAATLAEFVYTNNLSVILDLSGYEKKQRDAFLVAYLRKLWRLAGTLRRLHFILIEEARQFIPQTDRSELRDLLTDYATMGRKWGLGLIIVNQRSSNISKDVLSQCGILILHQVAHSADMSIYKDLIPGMSGKQVEATVRGLKRGQAVYVRGAVAEVISIRERRTFHAGSTPDLVAPSLRTVDEKLLADLRALLSPEAKAPETPAVSDEQIARTAALRVADAQMIADLRRQLVDREMTIKNLQDKIADQDRSIKALNARVYTPDLAAKQAAQAAALTPPVVAPTIDKTAAQMQQAAATRQARTEALAIQRQKKDLDALCEKIRAAEKKDRIMLASCLEKPGLWVDPVMVATRFRYTTDCYRKKPPSTLIALKVIERGQEKTTKRPIYRLSESLRSRYPGIDGSVINAKVFAACGIGG